MNRISYFLNNSSVSKKITPRAEDFSKWYLDIIEVADLAEHGLSKGSMVIKPYGYAIWQLIQDNLNDKIAHEGVPNMYFPIFIPENLLHKEASHVEGFSPEVAVVTHAGGKELEEPLVVRPTSETIIYESFAKWVSSYRDLPMMINQWANVVRWEMRPRLFLRSTEFLWQEGHTAHATIDEADEFARKMLNVYKDLAENLFAIQPIAGEKCESERFAGALKTYTIETIMQDGKALQFATSHNLGDNFSKVFDVKFSSKDGGMNYAGQTSWGLSTRSIGGLIMSHSDDKGLVLPPKLAPIQAVIMPVNNDDAVIDKCNEIAGNLERGARVFVDDRESRIGEKHFAWEKRGVPIRIELGPKDIESNQVVVTRRDKDGKQIISIDSLERFISDELADLQDNLFKASKERVESKVIAVKSLDEAKQVVDQGNFASVNFEIKPEDEKELKESGSITIRCYPFDNPDTTILAKSY